MRHHKEDLEAKVQALEEDHQQIEAKGQSMTEQLGHSVDREKGLTQFCFVVIQCYDMCICCA